MFDPKLRANERNPHNSCCTFGLRRVCGTCTHFEGEDRRRRGRCGVLCVAVHGHDAAGYCDLWTRPMAEVTQ